ncbi:hypothetical protein BDV96DRAFT_648321 [Lophiotrema nucula]|uniref:Uncharacterized protein n=1 Tax=Lophiotrema nucula TaxID=690887 RepID=A0A6A5Z2R9_9PLEO|nr:hypothetical protein BDV96DRAFT_648321 [Lophiotrema nucula]
MLHPKILEIIKRCKDKERTTINQQTDVIDKAKRKFVDAQSRLREWEQIEAQSQAPASPVEAVVGNASTSLPRSPRNEDATASYVRRDDSLHRAPISIPRRRQEIRSSRQLITKRQVRSVPVDRLDERVSWTSLVVRRQDGSHWWLKCPYCNANATWYSGYNHGNGLVFFKDAQAVVSHINGKHKDEYQEKSGGQRLSSDWVANHESLVRLTEEELKRYKACIHERVRVDLRFVMKFCPFSEATVPEHAARSERRRQNRSEDDHSARSLKRKRRSDPDSEEEYVEDTSPSQSEFGTPIPLTSSLDKKTCVFDQPPVCGKEGSSSRADPRSIVHGQSPRPIDAANHSTSIPGNEGTTSRHQGRLTNSPSHSSSNKVGSGNHLPLRTERPSLLGSRRL